MKSASILDTSSNLGEDKSLTKTTGRKCKTDDYQVQSTLNVRKWTFLMSVDSATAVLLNHLADFTLALQASSPLQPFLDYQNFPSYPQHPSVLQNSHLTSGPASFLIYYRQNIISKIHSYHVIPLIKNVWVLPAIV